MIKRITLASTIVLLMFCIPSRMEAQKRSKKQKQETETQTQIAKAYEGLEYRLIGPFRGGRSAAVTGVPGEPNLFYFGATGGGVWKTIDGGRTWENISDGYFGGSIGSVSVASSTTPRLHRAQMFPDAPHRSLCVLSLIVIHSPRPQLACIRHQKGIVACLSWHFRHLR